MTNADLFKQIFGIYATDLWSKPEAEFLEWLNSEQEPKWIPVSERLPDSQTEVIVSCRDDSADNIYRYTASGWITTDGEYWIVDNEINPYVIAWMPLPKPYEPQESEDTE